MRVSLLCVLLFCTSAVNATPASGHLNDQEIIALAVQAARRICNADKDKREQQRLAPIEFTLGCEPVIAPPPPSPHQDRSGTIIFQNSFE